MDNLCKTISFIIITGVASNSAHAALLDGSTLSFDPINTGGSVATLPADGLGSWFAMELAPGNFIITPVTNLNGLILGSSQSAGAFPLSGNIDQPWLFSGSTGAHQTSSDSSVLAAIADSATIDFSGWGVSWKTTANIDLNSGAWNGNAEGIAEINCLAGSGCNDGASYTLDYSATTAQLDPSGKSSVRYALHLEGTISAVPLPASVWLFVSGLLAISGLTRFKNTST